MRLLGLRRRGPSAGRVFCAPRHRESRECPVFRLGGLLANSLPVAREVLSSTPPRAKGAAMAAVSSFPAQRGSSGFFTEPGCVTAAWPREPSGVLNHARRRCWPRSGYPQVPAASSAWAVGRLSQGKRGKKASVGCTCPGGPRGVLRAAGGRPPPPLPSPMRRLFVPLPRLLQSEPPWQRGHGPGITPVSAGRCLL